MTPQPHPRVASLVLALSLCCWAVTGRASSWLRFEEERIQRLRTELLRIDDDVKQGKLTEEQGQLVRSGITKHITELEKQVLLCRPWAELGKADAQRDLIRGKVFFYSIDDIFFPELRCRFGVEQADWKQAREELTGVAVLPIRPIGIDVELLRAWGEGYNEQVRMHLRARHGQDIEKRISARAWQISEQRRHRGQTTERVELFVCFNAVLGAALLLALLVKLRKSHARKATLVAPT